MEMNLANLLLVISTFITGLIAGLFYGYQVSVNKGISVLADIEYIKAMQGINQAILNPWFLTCFMGAILLLPINSYFQYQASDSKAFVFFLVAAILYIVGVFGVTMFGNVPLNEELAIFDSSNATQEMIEAMRLRFEVPWNKLHLIRTLCSGCSFLFLLLGISFRLSQ